MRTITGHLERLVERGQRFPVSFVRFWISIGAKGRSLLDWQEVLTRQSLYTTTLTRAILPTSNHCPEISPQLLCCSATRPSVSCMPMKVAQTCEHQNLQSIPSDVNFEGVKSIAKSVSWSVCTHVVVLNFAETNPSRTLSLSSLWTRS